MKQTALLLGILIVCSRLNWADDSTNNKSPAEGKTAPATAGTLDTTPDEMDPTEAAIREQLRAYVTVFNKHDAADVTKYWSADGVSIDLETGERTEGRESLQQEFAEFFKQYPQARLSGHADTVRMVRPDVALVEGQVTLVTGEGDPIESSYTALLVKEQDRWLINSSQERDLPQPATSYDALKELEWLVGTWQDDVENASVITTVRWSESRAFLIRSFNVQHEDGDSLSGTQVIGWDPLNKQIRSWTFHSDGSFGEGFASKNDKDWMIKMSHVHGDGRVSSGTQVITRVDDDTLSVQTIGETIDGELVPASDPVTVVRIEDADAAADEVEATDKGESP